MLEGYVDVLVFLASIFLPNRVKLVLDVANAVYVGIRFPTLVWLGLLHRKDVPITRYKGLIHLSYSILLL